MANPAHVAKLKEGAEIWNEWRIRSPQIEIDLSDGDLDGVKLCGADLSGANLISSRLGNADLRSVDFSGATLTFADLGGANISDADLGGTSLAEANLSRANLTDSYLYRADLKLACLDKANLRRAQFSRTDLSGAKLTGADLAEARIQEVNLSNADLSGADLTCAVIIGTMFADTTLSSALGLETCVHIGPSTVDHRTITRSARLPLSFLRGCGLPDNLIDYLPSLLNQPIQFYSCFISYSTHDQEFADRIHADLQNKGVRCWFAPHHIQGGKKIYEQIDEAIRVYDRLLLILSDNSMKSGWVETEISKARKRELREKRRMLFPVRLVDFQTLQDWESFDADTGKDSAREIREYFMPDFSNWKDHDSYQKAFGRLLRDLKADEVKAQKA